MTRIILVLVGLGLLGFVAVNGLQAGGGLKLWGVSERTYDGSPDKPVGYTMGLKRLWLKQGTSMYVDYAAEIDSGRLRFVLEEIASLGEDPISPAERRVTGTSTGSAIFPVRKDGMYRLRIVAEPGSKWGAQEVKLRYKIKWGLVNPEKDRKPLQLKPVKRKPVKQ